MAYKPDKHGRDHCPGGEDPIPCLTQVAILTGWEADTTGAVTSGMWIGPAGIGFFNDGYNTDAFAIDLDTGNITQRKNTLAYAVAHVQFSDDFDEGDIIAVGITQTGPSAKIINQITCGAGGALDNEHFSVAAPVWNTITNNLINVSVYHDHGSDRTLQTVTLTVSLQAPLFPNLWVTAP